MNIDEARAVIHQMLADLWGFDEVVTTGDDDHVPLGNKHGVGAIEVLDGEPPVVRVTLTAATGVEPTFELLTTLSAITAASRTLSVHFEDGEVVVRRSDYLPVVDPRVLSTAMQKSTLSPTGSVRRSSRCTEGRPAIRGAEPSSAHDATVLE